MERLQVTRFSFRRRGSHKKDAQEKEQEFDYSKITHLSIHESIELEDELIQDYGYSSLQLRELLGLSCALALNKVYPLESLSFKGSILMCCGKGRIGATGLSFARHVKLLGYRPSVFCPQRTADHSMTQLLGQCEKMDIPFLLYLPSDPQLLTDCYSVIVDAMQDATDDDVEVAPEFSSVVENFTRSNLPVISLDIPTGWRRDEMHSDGVQPDCLLSLLSPKHCSRSYRGKHLVVGRFTPLDLIHKYGINLPAFQLNDLFVEIKPVEVEGDNCNSDGAANQDGNITSSSSTNAKYLNIQN